MPRALILLLLLALPLSAQDWPQWGRTPQHDGATAAVGGRLDRIEATMVIDPFVPAEEAASEGDLTVHYPVPLVDGDDLYLLEKSGVWNVKNVRRTGTSYTTRWEFASDWSPPPFAQPTGGPQWEPVFHPILGGDIVWIPGAGGTMFKVRRGDGSLAARVNPFGFSVNFNVYAAGPPVLDAAGNLFYNAIELDPVQTWAAEPVGAWLVRIGSDGSIRLASFAALAPNAPAPGALCIGAFRASDLPFPPNPAAAAPLEPCGAQRPGINATPAVGADGTIYTVSRAQFNYRYSFLIAVNPDMTPKWAASMRERFLDGCNVTLPPNGAPGGCRAGAATGVDPTDNRPGSGTVIDDATSSPVVLPDGNILYGAYSQYNYSQGHLMKFSAAGAYLGAYGFGWDMTPAVWRHGGTYSIVQKENHYNVGSYCDNENVCPPRNDSAPNDPERYFITQLDPALGVEWQFRNTQTDFCFRFGSTVRCQPVTTHGFEWCVNAVAVDGNGTVFANSEDGFLYAIRQGGTLQQRIFLDSAQGAAYTPLSIGADGRVYTQNNGKLFVIVPNPRRRVVR